MVDRAIRRSPKSAARGLAEWAIDLWPYVNGKALTLGLRLADMEMRDMLDVVHYLFEEDSRYSSAEEAESVSAMRSSIYGRLYGTTYRYGIKTKGKRGQMDTSFSDPNELKPYIPPTEFDPTSTNPFGSVLDAPIG